MPAWGPLPIVAGRGSSRPKRKRPENKLHRIGTRGRQKVPGMEGKSEDAPGFGLAGTAWGAGVLSWKERLCPP